MGNKEKGKREKKKKEIWESHQFRGKNRANYSRCSAKLTRLR